MDTDAGMGTDSGTDIGTDTEEGKGTDVGVDTDDDRDKGTEKGTGIPRGWAGSDIEGTSVSSSLELSIYEEGTPSMTSSSSSSPSPPSSSPKPVSEEIFLSVVGSLPRLPSSSRIW